MARRALDPTIRSKEPYEYRVLRPDGTVRWVVAHGEAVFADVGGKEEAIRYTGTIQDVTERKEAEVQLEESEARLRLAVDAARLAIWEYDSATAAIKSTPELNRILGFPEGEAIDIKKVEARYLPGEQQRLRAAGEAALAARERYFQVEYRYLWPDQTIRWLLLRAEIRLSDDGAPSGALGILMDITEEKQAAEHRQLLVRELQHRVNNSLALVSAIANQTFGGRRASHHAAALSVFSARLSALGQAHSLLAQENWHPANLDDIVRAAIKPHGDRFDVSGPKLRLESRQVPALSLALNELATNAAKYGALSNLEGRVEITWWINNEATSPYLHFRWSESGGPAVSTPRRTSFGTRLIREALATDFNGEVNVQYLPGRRRLHSGGASLT